MSRLDETIRPEPQLTEEQSKAFAENGDWEQLSLKERAEFQLYQNRLAMPFGEFHAATEHALGRPVYTHEFADPQSLRDELIGIVGQPSFAEILGKLPAGKPVLVIAAFGEAHDDHS